MANNQSPNRSLKIQRIHEDAILPTIGSNDSACYDLYAIEDVVFNAGEIHLVRTGWKIEPPEGWRINIYVRSSTPLKKNFILANSVGIIDEDYRGEFMVQLMNVAVGVTEWTNQGDHGDPRIGIFVPNKISKGDKIAQFELVPSNPASLFPLMEVGELSATQRGEGGFGSTGK